MTKKIHILGISPCFLETGKKDLLRLFDDKKNRIDTVFARKEDSDLLARVREHIASENKSITVENGGNITHLNNAAIFYDSKIKFIIDYIKGNLGKKNVLIIANGDPNYFGIGGAILSKLKEGEKRFVEIYPTVNFMQIGFAKLKIPMTEAVIVSLHGRDLKNIYPALYSRGKNIGIYTDNINTPYKIRAKLEEKGFLEYFNFYVLTDLCTKSEKIHKSFTQELLEDIGSKKNIVILSEKTTKNFEDGVIGIDDDKYIHVIGEPTKKEVRVVSIGLLDLKADSIVVDAGCGSGSVSMEVSAIARNGIVYAIDKNITKIENLKKNIKKFWRPNIEPILGELPGSFKTLKDTCPTQVDSVFIGGGGSDLIDIITGSLDILKDKGVIVINSITINSLNNVLSFINNFNNSDSKNDKNNNFEIRYEIISVNVARLKSIKKDSYFQALNQIYITKIIKTLKLDKVNKPNRFKSNIKQTAYKMETNKPNVKVRNKTIKPKDPE